MTTPLHDLEDAIADLKSVRDRLAHGSHGHESGPLASDVYRDSVARGARIRTSRSREGTWYAYVVMPDDFTPRGAARPRWINNPQSGHWWTDVKGETENEARAAALKLLVDEALA